MNNKSATYNLQAQPSTDWNIYFMLRTEGQNIQFDQID